MVRIVSSRLKRGRKLARKATNGNGHTNGNGNGHRRDTGKRETIKGVVDRAWPNDYQGKKYYFAKVNGLQLQTTEPGLGEPLLRAVGQKIEATAEPSPKPGKYYLKGFDFIVEAPQGPGLPEDDSLDMGEAEVYEATA